MMKITFAALALAIAAPVLAQNTSPVSRAEVKAETRALEKAGKLTPAGEGSPTGAEADFKSTKTRTERKDETLQAAKNHELTPAGSAGAYKTDNAIRNSKTTRSRPERKEETRLAQKERELIPAGEGPQAPRR